MPYIQVLFLLVIISLIVGLLRAWKDPKTRTIFLLTGSLVCLLWLQITFMNTYLTVHGHRYQLLIAETPNAQETGLSGRRSLPTSQAMLFPFHGEAVRCLWMKDMYFPIDMVWLNASKQVGHIAANVSPSTYPETFCPAQPAAYVLELNAGQAQQAGIKLGEKLAF